MKNVLSRPAGVLLALAAFLLGAWGPSTAYADFLQATFYAAAADTRVPGGVVLGLGPGAYPYGRCFSGTCEASSLLLGYRDGSGIVLASGSADPGAATNYDLPSSTQGQLTFYFSVLGDTHGLIVPVTVDVSMSVTAASDSAGLDSGFGEARFSVDDITGSLVGGTVCASTISYCGHAASFSGELATSIHPGSAEGGVVGITLFASGYTIGGNYSAMVDPMVSFAPGFDSTGLSLVFSPNPPSLSSPEPTSLLFLGTGIATLLGVARGKLRRFDGSYFAVQK